MEEETPKWWTKLPPTQDKPEILLNLCNSQRKTILRKDSHQNKLFKYSFRWSESN